MTSDEPISPEHQAIARHAAAVFGGAPRVADYANTPETRFIGILSAADRPGPGVTSYSTIKLSDHPLPWDGGEFPARIELAGVCDSNVAAFPNLLASAAFHIMQAGVLYRPGMVIPNLVRDAGVSSSLPHVYLTTPFLWGPALDELAAGTKMVTWLLAMPIAETELAYLREHGDDALETLFEEQRIDIFNVERPAVV
jgi:hypothetical protein